MIYSKVHWNMIAKEQSLLVGLFEDALQKFDPVMQKLILSIIITSDSM